MSSSIENQFSFASEAQKKLIAKLCDKDAGQASIFEQIQKEDSKTQRQFLKQLEELDDSYADGGLLGYIHNARKLLENSSKGVNPLEGWVPSVPTGENFEIGTKQYEETEAIGIKELGSVGFVLVAGGLGERLGYNGIKVGLPTEMSTETCYLQFYIEYILAVQDKYGSKDTELPLCIMTSADTNDRTIDLLKRNHYFGMKTRQVTIVQQGQGVPALIDNNATMAVENGRLVTKPHGHGDIHALLYTHGVASKWRAKGIKWLTLFQDTNGLAFHTLPLMLGVSKKLNLIMNSLAVPRKAKQAIGAITQLKHKKTKETKTIK